MIRRVGQIYICILDICIYICILYICRYTYLHVYHMYIYRYIHRCIYIYMMYICIHVYMFTYIYTHQAADVCMNMNIWYSSIDIIYDIHPYIYICVYVFGIFCGVKDEMYATYKMYAKNITHFFVWTYESNAVRLLQIKILSWVRRYSCIIKHELNQIYIYACRYIYIY